MPDGFEGVEIPSFLPEDVGVLGRNWLSQDELRTCQFIHLVITKVVMETPVGVDRTVLGLIKMTTAMSKSMRSMSVTDAKRAASIIVGAIKYLEYAGVIRCEPSLEGEQKTSPKVLLSVVTLAGAHATEAGRKVFSMTYAWGMLLGRDEFTHEMVEGLNAIWKPV